MQRGPLDDTWLDADTGRLRWPPPTPGGDPNARLYFLHVPKTAGISLDAVLRAMYPLADVLPRAAGIYPGALDRAPPHQYRYLGGHYSLKPLRLLPEQPAIVTIVREPTTMLRSSYEHGRRNVDRPGRVVYGQHTYEEWLRAADSALVNRNIQARELAGLFDEPDADEELLFERAIETLERCLWSSTFEDLDVTLPHLSDALEWPIRSLPVHNAEPAHARDPERERYEELVAARAPVDVRIHEYVRRRIRSLPPATGGERFRDALVRVASPLTAPVIADLVEPFWGDGWGTRAAPPGQSLVLRWAAAGRPASIDLPVRLRAGDRVEVFVGFAREAQGLTGLQVAVDGCPAGPVTLRPGRDCFVATVEVPDGVPGAGPSTLSLTSPPLADDTVATDGLDLGVWRVVLTPAG